MNNLRYFVIIAAVAVFFGSCGNDFLKEEYNRERKTDHFSTPEGLREAALGLPAGLRLLCGGEYGFALHNLGTDEFSLGSDPAQTPWNNYDNRLQGQMSGLIPNIVSPEAYWNRCYAFINMQNTVILGGETALLTDPTEEVRRFVGWGYFMRGWTYFNLVQQWGNVPLILIPSDGELDRNVTLTNKPLVLQQVIDDLNKAYDMLDNPATRIQGYIYKDAAAHFLAKALLYRASEINDDFNGTTKSADLTKALLLCEEVIANRQLADNFADMHRFTGNADASERLPEIILSAQFGTPAQGMNGRSGNNLMFMFPSVYQTWTGMQRDINGGREYARMRTTDYAMDVFDRVNDSRFWKSFRTTQRTNHSRRVGLWGNDVFSDVTFVRGQLGVMFIINDENDAERFEVEVTPTLPFYYPGSTNGRSPRPVKMDYGEDNWDYLRCPETNRVVPNVIPRYRKVRGATHPDYGYDRSSVDCTYPSLSKHLDGTRLDVTSSDGARDFVNARVAETWLIAAEIKVRQGLYAEALPYINKIRERAAYKADEDRGAYVDGGHAYKTLVPNSDSPAGSSYWERNTYYVSNNIPETETSSTVENLKIDDISVLPAEDEAIIAKLGYSSVYDRMMCLILNERTRELAGEMVRWEDLVRTKTLEKRLLAFNDDAIKANDENDGFIATTHYRRPIPQQFLDQIWKDGRPLTSEEKKALQNPGYN